MAHLCKNYIEFSGARDNENAFLNAMANYQQQVSSKVGAVIPEGYDREVYGDNNGLCSLSVVKDEVSNQIVIECESRWSPPYNIMRYLAEKFNVVISVDYDELASFEYGTWVYNGELKREIEHYYLSEEEINEVFNGEWGSGFEFRGEWFDSKYDIFDKLLDDKKEGKENVNQITR